MSNLGMIWIAAVLGLAGVSEGEATSTPDKVVAYPTYGVKLIPPSGWAEMPRDKGSLIARWMSADSSPSKPAALIMVECGRAKGDRPLKEIAEGLAKSYGGRVDEQPTTLGAVPALRVVANPKGASLQPVEAVAAIHDGFLYLIMGGATPGHSVGREIEAIRAAWEWMPIDPPSKHLDFHEKPLTAFGESISLNLPVAMYTRPTDQPDRMIDAGLLNLRRNGPEFLAYIQLAPKPPDQTFDKDLYLAELRTKLQAKGWARWHPIGGDSARLATDWSQVGASLPGAPPDPSRLIRWALIDLEPGRVVLINFTLNAQSDEERAAYDRAVERIIGSVEALNKGASKKANPR